MATLITVQFQLLIQTADPRSLVDNTLGFSALWFEPCSGHMLESQVLLIDGQVFFPRFPGFRPPLLNDCLDMSEIFLKGM